LAEIASTIARQVFGSPALRRTSTAASIWLNFLSAFRAWPFADVAFLAFASVWVVFLFVIVVLLSGVSRSQGERRPASGQSVASGLSPGWWYRWTVWRARCLGGNECPVANPLRHGQLMDCIALPPPAQIFQGRSTSGWPSEPSLRKSPVLG
jgi:hypothetical protein